MEEKVVCDNEYAFVVHRVDQHAIKFQWKEKFASKENFKTTVDDFATLVEQLHPKILFVDARKQQTTINKELQDWHDGQILPRYNRAGVKRMAFLIPVSIFSEVTHRKAFETETAKELLETQFFKSEEEAFVWLQEA